MGPDLFLSCGRSIPVPTSRVVRAAANLAGQGSPSVFVAPRVSREDATLGGPLLDTVDCTLICTAEDLPDIPRELLPTFTERLIATSETELVSWAEAQMQSVFQVVCLAGHEVSWQKLASLAQRGFGASWLQLPAPSSTLAGRAEQAPIVIWLVAPANDPYTRAIAEQILPALSNEVARLNRTRPRCILYVSSTAEHADASIRSRKARPDLVILLTHGDEDGRPLLAEAWQAQVLDEVARGGGVVMHLGCFGAGQSSRPCFEPLTELLELEALTPCKKDSLSRFARELLTAGATGVLAHVGETWSTCFENPSPFCQALAWIVSGAPLAQAITSLHQEADRQRRVAHDAFRANDAETAAFAWLRGLDLQQFVLLGAPLGALGQQIERG